MNLERTSQFVRRINAKGGPKGVVYVAGGGTEVFPLLLAGGGGSSTLLSGRIPYDPADFREVLGHDPGRLVDERASRSLAMSAFRHALSIRGVLPPDQVFGLGSTSKLSRGEGEREGRSHEVHATLQTSNATIVQSVRFPEGMDREVEERINALLLLNLIARGKGLDESIPLEHGGHNLPESASSERIFGPDTLGAHGPDEVLIGTRQWVALEMSGGRAERTVDPPQLLLSGSFRPLHAGHLAMAEAASRWAGIPCSFELSLFHPDKPPLDYMAIQSRIEGFGDRSLRVYLTDAPSYLDKARIFPGCTFALGYDTMGRVLDPRYYGGIQDRNAVLAELEALGITFLVFGRADDSGRFESLDPARFEIPVAGFLERNARPIPEDVFRLDLSSTEIRARSGIDHP